MFLYGRFWSAKTVRSLRSELCLFFKLESRKGRFHQNVLVSIRSFHSFAGSHNEGAPVHPPLHPAVQDQGRGCYVMYVVLLWQRVMAAGARQGCLGAFVLQSDVGFVQENLRVIEQVSPRPTCLVVFAYFTHLSTM